MHKRIAVDLAKSVYQVAESVRAGQVSQRKRLNRESFRRYIHEQQQFQQLHGLRETWKKSRTQRINLLRGIFREMGIEALPA